MFGGMEILFVCDLCRKYGYSVQGRVLVKRARYKTNHFHKDKVWAFSQVLVDRHLNEVDLIRVVETDLGRTWEIALPKFVECRETRFDTEHEPQYMLRDWYWTVTDPRAPVVKKTVEPVREQQLTLAI
jgi:hypothetical protein